MPYDSPLIQIPLPSASDPANVPSDLQNAFYKMEKYGIITCTSTTRPSSPHSGMTIYETDTRKIYMYVGTAWLHHNPIVNCTSTTRPATPYQGMRIYETNTGNYLVYYGSVTGWRPSWNQPWGIQSLNTRTTSVTFSSTSAAPVSDLTVSLSHVANRRYRIQFDGTGSGVTNSGFLAALRITDMNGVTRQERYKDVRNTTDKWPMSMMFVFSPTTTAGTPLTMVPQGWNTVSSCSWRLDASSTQPITMLVEDIGPNGNAPSS